MEYVDIFNDQDNKSCDKIEIDRYFLKIENLRTLNVFMGLNIFLYKETIGEKNDLCNPAIPSIWELKLNAALKRCIFKDTE